MSNRPGSCGSVWGLCGFAVWLVSDRVEYNHKIYMYFVNCATAPCACFIRACIVDTRHFGPCVTLVTLKRFCRSLSICLVVSARDVGNGAVAGRRRIVAGVGEVPRQEDQPGPAQRPRHARASLAAAPLRRRPALSALASVRALGCRKDGVDTLDLLNLVLR